jgi:hypothetical protein
MDDSSSVTPLERSFTCSCLALFLHAKQGFITSLSRDVPHYLLNEPTCEPQLFVHYDFWSPLPYPSIL